jgi:ATP-dependent Clp protease adaptor protein ClpS
MDSMPEAIAMGAAALGAFLLVVGKVRGRLEYPSETLSVLSVASLLAGERGHRLCTVTHVAMALLSDASVARLLERSNASPEDLYEDLERLLPARGEGPRTLKSGDHTVEIVSLLRASSMRTFRPRPLAVLAQLLRHDEHARAVFEKHGITAAGLQGASPQEAPADDDAAASGEYAPYRAPPRSNATTDVVFWNDRTTSMAFVVGTLRATFGIVEPYATTLMLRIHRDGVAVVGTYEREEAERLSAASMRLAADRGFPLKVTVDDATRTRSMPRIERWLRRQR